MKYELWKNIPPHFTNLLVIEIICMRNYTV